MGWSKKRIFQEPYAKCLDDNDILMYLIQNEGMSVVNWKIYKNFEG